MIKNHLIIVAFNLPWNWTTDYTNQTARLLSKNNLVICCLLAEPRSIKEHLLSGKMPRIWRKADHNLFVSEVVHILPFRRFRFISNLNFKLNALILKLLAQIFYLKRCLKKKILWVFDPQFYDFYHFFKREYFLLYDCVDYFAGSYTDFDKKNLIEQKEVKLLKQANLVVVNSHILKKIHKSVRSDIKIAPLGFRLENFINPKETAIILPKNKPVIGYIGAINSRLDFSLIKQLITRNPQWNFVFIGPLQENLTSFDALANKLNFFYYPQISKEEIPSLINQFTIGMIPYNTTQEFNRYCYPTKLFEYFYMGKPTISTPIEELKRFPCFAFLAKTAIEWQRYIEQLLSQPWPSKYKLEQKKLAQENSWYKKIDQIEKTLKQR